MTDRSFADSQAIQELLDALPVAVFVKDADSRFLFMNKACEAQWGFNFSQLRGTDGSQLFPPEQMEWFLAKDREVFAAGRQIEFVETVWNAALQTNRIGHTFKKPIYDSHGNPRFLVGAVIDVTERMQSERVLRMSEEKLRTLFEMSPLGIARNAMDGTFIEANAAFLKIVGYSIEELNRLTYWDLTPKEYEDMEARQLESLEKTSRYGPYEKEYIDSEGRRVPVQLMGMLITGGDGEKYIWSIVEDITERKRVVRELQLAAQVFQSSSEGMLITDSQNRIIGVNPAFTRMSGYTLEEIAGKDPRIFKTGYQDPAFYEEMWRSLRRDRYWRGELWDRCKDGDVRASRLTINAITNEDGEVQRYVALYSDITEKKRSDETIWKQANFDVLTRLPNRRMFRDRLEQEVLKSNRSGTRVALFLIDLDRFKEVNDTLGHALGDLLLRQAAHRLAGCVRQSDTVARLGGDEFTVVLSNSHDVGHVETVAQKIVDALAEPFQLEGELAYVTASIGITLYPSDAKDVDALIRNADQAMYAAKEKGRNRFCYFTPALQEAALHRLRLINDLRQALPGKQLSLHFQPIVNLSTGRILKAEALLRWTHPVRGTVSPMDFIPLAEHSGLIGGIGDWVFREAAVWAKRWRALFPEGFQVSVNESPVQFRLEGNVHRDRWRQHLQDLDLPGESMVVEITEGILLNAESDVESRLLGFRDEHVQVAIDDFGTGYSALGYLKKFHIDYVKIDRSFVRDLATDADDLALSEAIVVMAHKLGLKVIAEGIETEEQRALLLGIGCDLGQGYLFARPMAPEQLEQILIRQQSASTGSVSTG
jgi:diguanylate cyclase (GGDEF)-like protein/PAS domain S-box-containing protein